MILRRIRQRHPALIRGTLLAFCFFFSFGVGLGYASWAMVCRSGRCPAVQVLDEYQPRQTSKLYAADGRFIAELGLEKRTIVNIKDIPKIVQDAFIVTEDRRFWEHHGVDFHSVPGAVAADDGSGSLAPGVLAVAKE